MYDTVLVPLDGSSRAEAILAHLPAWVSSPGGEIVLLLVVQAPIVTAGFKTISVEKSRREAQRLTQEGRDYLDRLARSLGERKLSARCIVEVGAVVETIMAVAEREAADMVAMASHGRSGLSWVFYGSVASGVLQQVDRPLVLIRSRES